MITRPGETSIDVQAPNMSDDSRQHDARSSLWDRAYSTFCQNSPKLSKALQQILSVELPSSSATSKDDSPPEVEISGLIERQLARMEARELRFTIGRKVIQIRTQFERILKILSFVQGIASQAATVDPLHAGLPVAGLYLILSFATRDKDSRDVLLNGLEDVSNIVLRYATVEDVYLMDDLSSPSKLRLMDAMVKLYERIFAFQAEAACKFNHNIAFQTLQNLVSGSSVWNDRLSGIKKSDDACASQLPILDAEANSKSAEKLRKATEAQKRSIDQAAIESQKQIQGVVDELEKLRSSQERARQLKEHEHLLATLRTTEYEATLRSDAIPQRTAGTCEWFLENPQYQEWLKETKPALLWATADPGCGKSVLAKYLISDFERICGNACHVCYHFFKTGTGTESAVAALCAILHQLFSRDEDLLEKYGMPQYHRNEAKLASLFYPLWDIFSEVAKDHDRDDIVLVFDALDECEATYRNDLLAKLAETLAYNSHAVKIKVLITSTPDIQMQNTLAKVQTNLDLVCTRVHGEDQSARLVPEINLVIEENIHKFQQTRARLGFNDNVHDALRTRMQENPQRTYLWVAVIFSEMEQKVGSSAKELLKAFQELPNGVEQAYARRMARISPDQIEDAKKLLRIIIAAERELTLQELQVAYTVQGDGTFEQLNSSHDVRIFEGAVRHLCSFLVRVEMGKVYLIHRTAREYLIKFLANDSQTPGGRDSNAIADRVLVESCMWYLNSETLAEPWVQQNDRKEWKNLSMTLHKFLESHHFVEYAAINWTKHLNLSQAKANDSLCLAAVELCRSDSARYRTWSKIWWNSQGRRPPTNITDLAIAAAFDLVPVIETMLDAGYNVDEQDADGDTALISASLNIHERAASILIARGASPSLSANDGNTPLHSAAARDLAAAVKLLLEGGAEKEARNRKGRTPLQRAALYGHADVVRVLVNAGADVDAVDPHGRTALHLASLLGREDIKSRRGVDTRRYENVRQILIGAMAAEDVWDEDGLTAGDLYQKSSNYWNKRST